jgi:hypothetical protein
MKVIVNEKGSIQLEKVFAGVTLKTEEGEVLGICMRDTGFELEYNGRLIRLQAGVVYEAEKR